MVGMDVMVLAWLIDVEIYGLLQNLDGVLFFSRYLRYDRTNPYIHCWSLAREVRKIRPFLFVPVVAFAGAFEQERGKKSTNHRVEIVGDHKNSFDDGNEQSSGGTSIVSLVSSLDGNSIKQQYE